MNSAVPEHPSNPGSPSSIAKSVLEEEDKEVQMRRAMVEGIQRYVDDIGTVEGENTHGIPIMGFQEGTRVYQAVVNGLMTYLRLSADDAVLPPLFCKEEHIPQAEGCLRACHRLTFRNVRGEPAEVVRETCEKWVSGELKERLAGYSLNEVFNANETALYFKLLANKTIITFKGYACEGGERSQERITVVCANATGSEWCRLLIISKAAKPHCF
ncbi:hypothetical protein HPB50_028408 [Hyalomma asiaticum]|nr:hypothetical protein HPB50_028408 [Hyalomma asiaticum]